MADPSDPVVELKALLNKNRGWERLLAESIAEAKREAIIGMGGEANCMPGTLPEYFEYLEDFVRWVPAINTPFKWLPKKSDPTEASNMLSLFYWLIDTGPGRDLQSNEAFEKWMVDFANDWGSFLDTPESLTKESLESFENDPAYHMDEYAPNPSGWLTFNQMFAREPKPGMRPIAGGFDDRIVVSPADWTFKSKVSISDRSEIVVKNTHTYKILDLLEASPYKDRFADGLFIHGFLGPSDYHRYHTPVRGTVLESRVVQADAVLDVVIVDGQLSAPDGTGYQFSQTRGILVIDSPVGLVAMLPIGMAQVSSVNMTAPSGNYLNKGEECGYFLFGGSDIIIMFEPGSEVVITAAPMIHYNQGQCIGEVIESDV